MKHSTMPAKNARAKPAARWNDALPDPDEQYEIKRLAVLKEAGRAFSRVGFHNTSLDEIAKTLRVSKATLYYYFPTKQDLLFECHKLAMDLGDESVKRANQARNGMESLTTFVFHYVGALTSELGAFAVLSDLHALSPEQHAAITKRRDRFDTILRGYVKAGIADGSIRDVDPAIAVGFFMGAINWLTVWYRSAGPRSGAEIAQTFAELVADGLGKR